MSPFRVAVYFAPERGSVHAQAGDAWLGHLASDGARRKPILSHVLAETTAHTLLQEPQRYGFHGTLKAPFRLRAGLTWSHFLEASRALAADLQAFTMPKLQVCRMGHFWALRPKTTSPYLNQLATRCVQELHGLADALNEGELARRRLAPLTARQDELMLRWGYPYVMDEFRFHITLTGDCRALSGAEHAMVARAAEDCFGDLPSWHCAHLSLFVQARANSDFELVEQLPLGS